MSIATSNLILLHRIALVTSYCLISFTLIKDILGGLIVRILVHLVWANSIWLKIIGLLYIICLLAWIFPLWDWPKVAKPMLIISSIILTSPLLMSLFWQIREKNIELGFIVPTIIFFSILFFQLKELLRT